MLLPDSSEGKSREVDTDHIFGLLCYSRGVLRSMRFPFVEVLIVYWLQCDRDTVSPIQTVEDVSFRAET